MTSLPRGSLRERLTRGTLWTVAGTGTNQGLVLLSSFLVARALGRDVFGELGMIQGTVGMFGVLAGLGLGMTATRHVAQWRSTRPERAGRVIGLTLLVGALVSAAVGLALFVASPWIAGRFLNAPHLALELRIGCLLLVGNSFSQVCQGALAGLERFRTIALLNIAAGVLTAPAVVGGVYLRGLAGGVAGMAIASTLGAVLAFLVLRRQSVGDGVPARWPGSGGEIPVLWDFAVPSFLAGIIAGPVLWGACAILANQKGGYAELGVFNAARQWWLLILFLPTLIARTSLPLMTERLSVDDRMGCRRLMVGTLAVNGLVGGMLAAGLTLFRERAMSLFGDSFVEGGNVLLLMVWTAALLAVEAPVGQLLAASGRMWLGFVMNVGWALVLLSSFHWLKRYGASGLAGAMLSAYLVHGIWLFGYARGFLSSSDGAGGAGSASVAPAHHGPTRVGGRVHQ